VKVPMLFARSERYNIVDPRRCNVPILETNSVGTAKF
jgi:hypothetical protein